MKKVISVFVVCLICASNAMRPENTHGDFPVMNTAQQNQCARNNEHTMLSQFPNQACNAQQDGVNMQQPMNTSNIPHTNQITDNKKKVEVKPKKTRKLFLTDYNLRMNGMYNLNRCMINSRISDYLAVSKENIDNGTALYPIFPLYANHGSKS